MPRAAVLEEYNAPLVIRSDVEWVPLTSRRVLVRTLAAAFCGSDLMSIRGENGKKPPTILGHSAVGVIEELGSAVTGFHVGQRVVATGTPECGECFYCGSGIPEQCSEMFDIEDWPRLAFDSNGRDIEVAGSMGAYAELMNVSANQIWPIDDDIPDEAAAMYGCGLLTGWGSVFRTAKISSAESVVIVGAGHLGQWAVQSARIAGAGPIIVVEPIQWRRELAGELGATHLIDPAVEDPISAVHAVTGGRGADHAIELAGPVEAASLAFSLSRRAGTVVLAGFAGDGSKVSFDQFQAGPLGRRIIGTQNGNVHMRRDIPRVTDLLRRGLLQWEPIATNTYPLAEINTLRANAEARLDLTGIVLPQA